MSFSKFGRGDPMNEWSRKMRDIMDEMAQRSFVHFRDHEENWQPATDVFETRESYHIGVDLAGMNPAEVQVEALSDHTISIRGYRPDPRPPGIPGPLSVHVMEIDHGPFRRIVDLPEQFNIDAVEARYEEGYLWIAIPKKQTP